MCVSACDEGERESKRMAYLLGGGLLTLGVFVKLLRLHGLCVDNLGKGKGATSGQERVNNGQRGQRVARFGLGVRGQLQPALCPLRDARTAIPPNIMAN